MKISKIFLTIFACGIILCGCGSTSKSETMRVSNGTSGLSNYESYSADEAELDSSDSSAVNTDSQIQEKISYSYDISLQTKDYTSVKSDIENSIKEYGGYIESSNESNYDEYRNATIRAMLPADKADEFVSKVGDLAYVTNSNMSMDNLTTEYIDVDSRMQARIQERDKLQSLLDEAESMEDIIQIEDRLSQLQGEIESFESQLKYIDSIVDFSSVSIDLNEVNSVGYASPTVGHRILDGFQDDIEIIGDIFVWFVTALPVIIAFCVIVGIPGFFIIKLIIYLTKKLKNIKKRN